VPFEGAGVENEEELVAPRGAAAAAVVPEYEEEELGARRFEDIPMERRAVKKETG
jgi:hypothetical protein